MTVHDIVEVIVTFVREHESWAAPAAFVVAFMESFCFLSILWPGTAILVGISALLAKSGVELHVLWPAIIAAGVGGTLGYAVSYWIGLYYKDNIRNVWPFKNNAAMLSTTANGTVDVTLKSGKLVTARLGLSAALAPGPAAPASP